ncbi:hypothetical protein Pcinc_030802 [Petrolisthes cinctipes]|uniref:Uncharacterized protein n=1 Tax=Petrolisthes cinctipes TaxID=88211 RepID=A0AAE1K5T5_PETCI|nr:hypothetical protein Pcinc_030802 [Petrolisthes cinctipes]
MSRREYNSSLVVDPVTQTHTVQKAWWGLLSHSQHILVAIGINRMYHCWHKMVVVTSLLLSLLLWSASGVASQITECENIVMDDQASSVVSLVDPSFNESTLSFILTLENKQWKKFELGNLVDGTFQATHLLSMRNVTDDDKALYNIKLIKKGGEEEQLLNERLSNMWVDGVEVKLVFGHSRLIFTVTNGEERLKFDLITSQLRDVEVVEVKDINQVSLVQRCSLLPETTMAVPTTTPTTTTTTSTIPTTTTTTTTTTTIPTTTTPTTTILPTTTTTTTTTNPTTPFDPTTNTEKNATSAGSGGVIHVSTTLPPCEMVRSGMTESSTGLNKDCQTIPWWTWVCIGVLCAFVIITIVLVCYTVVLYRRNFELMETLTRQGHYLRGRMTSPGGYGEEAKDMQYLHVKSQSVVVGNTVPRIASNPSPMPPVNPTPSPLPPFDTSLPIKVQFDPTSADPKFKLSTSSIPFIEPPSPLPPPPVSCTVPRNSSYRRSFSHQPELDFPPPPESTPPMSFLTLPATSTQRGYVRDSLHSLHEETAPLRQKPRSHCSEDALADDENSDVSLDREFGVIC